MAMNSLIYKLAGPPARLMDKLKFRNKILLVVAVFSAAVVILSYFVVSNLREGLELTKSEQTGVSVLPKVRDLLLAVQDRRAAAVQNLLGDKDAVHAYDALAERIKTDVAALDAVFANEGTKFDSATFWKELKEPLAKILAEAPGEETVASTSRVTDDLIALREKVSDDTQLTLDPELDTYYLADLVSFKLSRLGEVQAHARDLIRLTLADGRIDEKELLQLSALHTISQFIFARVEADYLNIARGSDEAKAELGVLNEAMAKAHEQEKNAFDNFIASSDKSVAATPFLKTAEEERGATIDLSKQCLARLSKLLDARARSQTTRVALVLAICAGSLLIAFYLFIGFSRSLQATLRGLSRAAADLAKGEFPSPINLRSKDELQDIANELLKVTHVLQRFEVEQQRMFDEHAAGTISHRIPSHEFQGAYAHIMEKVNDLVAAHIAVKMRAVELVTGYANGDFTTEMEKLPGEKAKVSDAVNAVRTSIAAISTQIKTWSMQLSPATSPSAAMRNASTTNSAAWSKA